MVAYRELEPGLFELETDSGPLTVTASEDELRAEGHFPSIFKSGATAQNAAPMVRPIGETAFKWDNDQGGAGQIPGLTDALTAYRGPSVTDPRPEQKVGPVLDNSAGLAALRGGKAGPALTTAKEFREEEERQAEEAKAAGRGPLRGGGEVRELRGGGGGGQSGGMGGGGGPRGFTKGGDMRVGFTVAKSGLSPEQIEEAELAEADASIERKLGAQGLADKRMTRTEAMSAEMGRQIRAEGEALRQKQARDQAMREDYESRLGALEREREEVGKMNVTVADFIDDGDAASVVGALAMLAAAPAAAYNGGRNPALDAIERGLDRKLSQARERVAGKESELDRLTQIYGSPAEAEAEYRDRQRALVQAMGQKMALDAGATDAADNLRMQFAEWDDQRAQSRLARQEALAGRVTEQWAYQPPRAFGGAPAVKESDVQGLADDLEKAGIGESSGDAAEISDLISELPEGELPTPGSRNVASRAARSVVDFIGGEGSAAQAFDSDAERAGAAKFSRSMNTLKSKLLGAARSPAEIEDFNEGFANVRTKEGMRQFVGDWQRKIARREAGVKAGFRPEVVQTFEERQRSRQPSKRPSTLRGE